MRKNSAKVRKISHKIFSHFVETLVWILSILIIVTVISSDPQYKDYNALFILVLFEP